MKHTRDKLKVCPRSKKTWLWMLASLYLAVPGLALAERQEFSSGVERNQLIELYTSEGCSSCPPADRWLAQFADHPLLWKQIIPVAFHVDYWNYLGWVDPFAAKTHSRRQAQLKRAGNITSVYTPGFVVDGAEWRGFFRDKSQPELGRELVGELSLSIEGNQFTAEFLGEHNNANLDGYVLSIALLGMDLSTKVKSGENRGRRLEHQFVVLDKASIRSADASWMGDLKFYSENSATRYALVAWVTREGSLTPLQALGGWYQPHNLEIL